MLPRKLFSFLYALILFIGAGLMPILLADEAYANNTISGTVNENGTLVLTAPQGYKIGGIQFASYGTPVEYQIGECHATTSVAMVQAAISNESLSISASNDVFGDPCVGTGKRLSVILTIEPQVVQRSLAAPSGLQGEIVGTTATVSWSAPAQGNTPVERYAIFWSYDNWASGWAIASTSLSASISGIPAGQQVQIKVRADNDSLAVYSGWSNEIVLQATATPVPSSSPSPAPVEPTPEPSPTPSPTPTEQAPSPSPTPLPSSEPSPSASPEPTSSPSPTVEPSPVPSPSVSPEAEPTSSPTPTPQPTQETQPQPSPTPSPTPSPEPTVDPSVEAARLAEEQRVAAEAARIAAEVEAARQAAIAAEQARQNAIAEQNRIAAEAEAARQAQLAVLAEQQRQAAIEAARIAEEKARAQAEANAKAEAEARAAEEAAAQAEAERIEAEENARIAEEAAKAKEIEDARLEAERIAAEEANAKAEAEAKAAEEAAAKAEADRIAAEEAAAIAETERFAAEEAAAVAEAERIAQEEANAKAEAERLEAEAEAQAQEEANAKAEQERIVAEEKARIQEEADAKAEADAIKAELESKAKAEEAAALAKAKAEETAKAESFVEATGVIPNSPASLPTDKPVLPPQEALKPHIQEDKVGVENGGIQFFGTQSQPQVVGEDGQLTPPPPEPGSGDPIPADAITTEDTFIGQAGGVTFNSPDIAVPVEPIEINIEIPGVGEAAQALANTYVALANVGNDMSPITRKKAKKILLTTIIVGQIVSMRRM